MADSFIQMFFFLFNDAQNVMQHMSWSSIAVRCAVSVCVQTVYVQSVYAFSQCMRSDTNTAKSGPDQPYKSIS